MSDRLEKHVRRRHAPDLGDFRKRYPLTVASFASLGNREEWLRHIWELDAHWRRALTPWGGRIPAEEVIVRGAPPARLTVEAEFEVIYAGGTVGLLHAAVMSSRYSRSVMVFDEACVGETTREWNVSDEELRELERVGLFSQEELESAVLNRYRSGFVKFHDAASRVKTPRLWVDNVMDVAVDANRLLALAAARVRAAETSQQHHHLLLDGQRFIRAYVGRERVLVELESLKTKQRKLYSARLFVDSTQANSGVARQLNGGRNATHISPTVGTVARGFVRGEEPDTVDFRTGEILVSNQDAEDHRQLIWEGLAGSQKRDEYATHLFFYDAVDSPADKSLLALYERYFETIARYKRTGAQWRVVRPVFGYTPGFQQHGRNTRAVSTQERVMLIGDAAGLNSPLNFNSFGQHARQLGRQTHLTHLALEADLLDAASLSEISAEEPRVAQIAGLAEFLRPTPKSAPAAVNETLNAVMAALHDLDERVRRELFQDRMTLGALKNLLSRTIKLYPRILQRVREHLGARGTFWWLANIAEVVMHERRGGRDALHETDAHDEEAAQRFAHYVKLYQKPHRREP
jgi:lycopene cyclase CruA